MRVLVVYESMYGNTHAVATDIASGVSAADEVTLVPVTRASRELVAAADLIVAGAPTHRHGISTIGSRRMATETAREPDSGLTMDPDADGPGLRAWLEALNAEGVLAAAFDTRLGALPALTGREHDLRGRRGERIQLHGLQAGQDPLARQHRCGTSIMRSPPAVFSAFGGQRAVTRAKGPAGR